MTKLNFSLCTIGLLLGISAAIAPAHAELRCAQDSEQFAKACSYLGRPQSTASTFEVSPHFVQNPHFALSMMPSAADFRAGALGSDGSVHINLLDHCDTIRVGIVNSDAPADHQLGDMTVNASRMTSNNRAGLTACRTQSTTIVTDLFANTDVRACVGNASATGFEERARLMGEVQRACGYPRSN